MSIDMIRDKVKSSIVKITAIPFESIPDSAAYDDDLGLDSLTVVEIVIDVEENFSIKIPDGRARELRSIDDTVVAVQEYLMPSLA